MKKTLAAISMLLTMGAAGLAHADDDDWAGLYQAIDSGDGSINYLSIVPLGGGRYELVKSISLHDRCEGPAVIVATGTIVNRQLVREDVVLRCEGADAVDHGEATYTLDRDNEIISVPAAIGDRQIHYHRIGGDD